MPLFLRWIAVLPGAVLGGLAATFPLHWILDAWIFPHDGAYFLDMIEFDQPVDVATIELGLTPLIIAVFYVWAGAEIAPAHKLKVGVVLSLLFVCALAYLFFTSNGQATFEIKTAGALFGILLGLAIVWLRVRQIRLTQAKLT